MRWNEQLTQWWKIADAVWPCWRATNGFGQWCSLSLLITNIVLAIALRLLQTTSALATVRCFIDDKTALVAGTTSRHCTRDVAQQAANLLRTSKTSTAVSASG